MAAVGDEDTLRVGLTVRLDVPYDAMGPADLPTCVSLCGSPMPLLAKDAHVRGFLFWDIAFATVAA